MYNKEIGSNFWISRKEFSQIISNGAAFDPNAIGLKGSYLSTCRSAISYVLNDISDSRKVALVPAFTCHSVLAPFLLNGYTVHPFQILDNLSVSPSKFERTIDEINPSVILFHDYFGFNTSKELEPVLSEQKRKGVIIIEDLTQRIFSSFDSSSSNYQVGSLRKWMPIPDGAIISQDVGKYPEDTELINAKMEAMLDKGDYLTEGVGEKDSFRNKLLQAEKLLDSRTYPFMMSSLSRTIFGSVDLNFLKKVRRANYEYLLKIFTQYDDLVIPFDALPADVTPFMFPVLVKNNRARLQKYMAANSIYPTVIWACPEEFRNLIDNHTRGIYDTILCFHCDQRYGIEDMKRIGEVLSKYYCKNEE